MISATAPGKIILLGEHAVVYGQPALAIPLSQLTASVQIELEGDAGEFSSDWREVVRVSAPDIGRSGFLSEYSPANDPIALVIANVLKEMKIPRPPRCHIKIESTIPVASGLGSGAAVSVALARAMASAVGHELADDVISKIAFEAERIHHGTPSGIDNSVIAYEKPVYYVKDQPITTFQVKVPFTLVIADTGIRSSTMDSVEDVRKLWQRDPFKYQLIFFQIGEIVEKGRQAIRHGELENLGRLMNQDHHLLQELTVSSLELDQLTEAALSSGAYGAKLSGGGRGGNMIALVPEGTAGRVEEALLKAGAQRTLKTLVG
ncbi:MAG TPA: mevalonate kinase [Anaerolineales bacterium]|nr:mevalonate kinase [Anaerolineales bacterium]